MRELARLGEGRRALERGRAVHGKPSRHREIGLRTVGVLRMLGAEGERRGKKLLARRDLGRRGDPDIVRVLKRLHAEIPGRVRSRRTPERLPQLGVAVSRHRRRVKRGGRIVAEHHVEVTAFHVYGILSAPEAGAAGRSVVDAALERVDAVLIGDSRGGIREISLIVHQPRHMLGDGGGGDGRLNDGRDDRGESGGDDGDHEFFHCCLPCFCKSLELIVVPDHTNQGATPPFESTDVSSAFVSRNAPRTMISVLLSPVIRSV